MSLSKYLSVLLLFIGFGLTAQVELELELISDPNFENLDLSNVFLDVKVQIEVRNVGATDADLKWEFSAPSPTCRNDFGQFGCDNNACYQETTTSNVNPPGEGINIPSVLAAGESYIYELHVKPYGLAGCCIVNLAFSTTQDPDNILAELDVPYSVNDPLCEITSTEDAIANDIIWGPNPVTDVLSIESGTYNYNLELYNLEGKLLHTSYVSGSKQIDMSSFEQGNYLAIFKNEKGALVKTISVSKI